ncbi:33318_t:CDS:2, partial [Racocetra persica]
KFNNFEKRFMDKNFEFPSIILVGREGITVGNMLLKTCGNHNELFEKYEGPMTDMGRNQQQLKTAKLSIGEENFIL